MTNLTESSVWESGIYQLETTDPGLGGAPAFSGGVPVDGHANAQAQQLANRTKYLNDTVSKMVPLADYTALRSYTGTATGFEITSNGISGKFYVDASDITSLDDGGIVIIDGSGRRVKRDVLGSPIDVLWFRENLTSNDLTAAFNKIVTYVEALTSLVRATPVISIPAGWWTVSEKIAFTRAVHLIGAGRLATNITFSAPTSGEVGFYIPYTTQYERITVKGIGFARDVANGGVACRVEGLVTGTTEFHRVTIDDISVNGATYGFDGGIELHGVLGSWVANYEFVGLSADPLDANKRYGVALKITSPTTPVSVHHDIHDLTIFRAHKGVEAIDIEGVFVRAFNMVGVDYGISYPGRTDGASTGAGRLHLHVGPGHISARYAGVHLKAVTQCFIDDVLFHRVNLASVGTNYSHILCEGTVNTILSNNIYISGYLGTDIRLVDTDSITINSSKFGGVVSNQKGLEIDSACTNTFIGTDLTFGTAYTTDNRVINNGVGTVKPGGSTIVNLSTASLPNNTYTSIPFATTNYTDLGALWSGTNPTRLNIPQTGKYAIGIKLVFPGNDVGVRGARFYVNGVDSGRLPEVRTVPALATLTILSFSSSGIPLNKDDYVEIQVVQSSGDSMTLNGASQLTLTYLGI